MMFKNPFSFEGRIRRLEYGLTMLIYFLFALAINVLVVFSSEHGAGMLLLVLYLPVVWFVLAQGAKRCHDRNNSGWFMFIPFYSLWMLFAEGDRGENQYGHDPKGRDTGYTESNILDTPETF